MSSSSKDIRSTNLREDCQIHVDKEGESCVIKIESIGQEKMLKELLGRFNSLKSEMNQLISNQQNSPNKDTSNVIQDLTAKLKPLEDQLQQVNKHVGDDHVQLNKLNTDLNLKFDEIKQDLNTLKDQQKQNGASKDLMEKIMQKLDHLDRILRNSHEEGQKRLSTDFQNVQQTLSSRNESKPILDALQTLQTSFDKEKTKPDILARKLDFLDQKFKESHPEQMALIKDIQTKFDPLNKSNSQTHEMLTKINDRIKSMQIDTTKSHPDLLQKLDQFDQQLKSQPSLLLDPIKQLLLDQQNQTRKIGEEKLDNKTNSPNRVPLCINGVIPHFSDPHVLCALAEDIAKKLNDLQTKIPSVEQQRRKQDDLIGNFHKQEDLLKNLDLKFNHFASNVNEPKKRSDPQEISIRTEPLHQAIENLSKQQQPIVETLRELRQSQLSSEQFSSKFDQSIKAIQTDLHHQTEEILKNLTDTVKQSNTQHEQIEKNFQPFSQMIKTLRESIDQSQVQQQNETKNLEHHLSKTLETTPKSSEIIEKLNELTNTLHQSDPAIEKLSHDLHTIKTLIENQLVDKLNQHKTALKDIHSKVEPLHQASRDSIEKLDQQSNDLTNSLKEMFEKMNMKEISDRLKHLDETIKDLSKSRGLSSHLNEDNERQVPRSQSGLHNTNQLITSPENQIANLISNLLTLQTTIEHSGRIPSEDIQPYLKRIEQSPLVRNDPDLQKLLQRIDQLSLNNHHPMKTNGSVEQQTQLTFPRGYLTKSRYILFLSDQTIRENWPKLAQRSSTLLDAIVNHPFEFDRGTNLDHLIKQNNLEEFSSFTRNAIDKSGKDYDQISFMMDSIVFDQMTMIGSREALIRPWDPSLLNRSSSKGSYPYPSGNGRLIERFPVDKDISLWMVETDESKPYLPTEFLPNFGRLNEKYDRIQQPGFHEIRQKRREDETRWNERYAFTKENRTVVFVNDLRSYFMDYDTKRKYQVHDGVPINPVCRTGIAGRGDLPFWGPNHCVVVVLLRNINDPEVVLMKHHDRALVLPKGFYGHEARYDNQIKIIQDPVSGQILPVNLLDYWWTNTLQLNEHNPSISNIKRVLNEKELKEEFAEIFSQKGCNKSVFDNGYVDHPLNTDHAWVESSVWKIQLKDWRIPEMKSAKYAIAEEWKNHSNPFPFIWMKLTDAILVVPAFDRGILVDVLATGMPL